VRRVLPLALVLVSASPASAQICPASLNGISESASVSVASNSKTCTIATAGYIKTNTTYKLHVNATAGGTCTTYWRDGSGICQPTATWNRTAIKTFPYINGNPTGVDILANTNVTNYNTCGNGNCTPVNTSNNGSGWSTNSVGTYTYSATHLVGGGTTGTGAQYCNMGGTYNAGNQVTLRALACLPTFFTDAYDNIKHATEGNPQTTEVYIPPDMAPEIDAAFNDAVDGLNTTLAGSSIPVRYHVTYEDCESLGALCVKVSVQNTGTDCAQNATLTGPSSGGHFTVFSDIFISSNWTTAWYDNGFLTRTAAHELTHLLGLKENSCTSSDSVMGTFPSCGASLSNLGQTVNDTTPIANTVYGSFPRTACGS